MIDAPYPGLNPFREEDAALFFGRDVERDLIAANLTASRLTVLYGPSGVGKSSVLNAGVIAHMRRNAAEAREDPEAPDTAVVAFRTWQSDPRSGLLRALHSQIDDVKPDESLRNCLRRCAKDRDVYIILDQFEEYFLYQSATDRDGSFAADLAAAIHAPDTRANFLISIREDALARLDLFKGRIAHLFDNYLRIEHLTLEAGRAAIGQPVAAYNRLQPPGAEPVRVEEELAEEILRQLGGGLAWEAVGRGAFADNPAGARIEAPYLQLVLRRLWDEERRVGSRVLRLDTLGALEGSAAIVKTHLDKVLEGFSGPDRALASSLFHHLVTPSGAKIAHTAADLAAYVGSPAADIEGVLSRLAQAGTRIVREVPAVAPSRATRFEIYHDALAPAILDWRRRQQTERLEQGQRLAVSAFQDAITSVLTSDRSPEDITSYVRKQVEKISASDALLAPGALSGRTLLWVDDTPQNNLYEAGLLSGAGMNITTAKSTAEAQRHLESARFDVVVSDIHRNEGGHDRPEAGYDLLEWMRMKHHVRPFIFYTSNSSLINLGRLKGALGRADTPATLVELILRAVRKDDMQKGAWGGRPVRNRRRLSGNVTQAGPGAFHVVLTVSAATDEPLLPGDIDPGALEGEVAFHLHQTFPNPVLRRPVVNGVASCDVMAYGAFTVGAVADRGRTQLELDLALDPAYPEEFRAN